MAIAAPRHPAVIAAVAGHEVIAGTAEESIRIVTSEQRIVSFVAVECVVAGTAEHDRRDDGQLIEVVGEKCPPGL